MTQCENDIPQYEIDFPNSRFVFLTHFKNLLCKLKRIIIDAEQFPQKFQLNNNIRFKYVKPPVQQLFVMHKIRKIFDFNKASLVKTFCDAIFRKTDG